MGAFGFLDLGRKWFAVGPNRAIFEVFFFPDRNGLFQRIYQPAACVESRSTVCGCHDNEHAGFADFDPPEPMDDRQVANFELGKSS
jgi:hypothetical protein